MQYVPAASHNAALIAWLLAPRLLTRGDFLGNIGHVDRLNGHRSSCMRLLTPARADAWLREHVASEPTSLLHGVVL